MSRLHFVDAVALSRAPDFGSIAACEKLQTWFGLPQHLPFIIDDEGVPSKLPAILALLDHIQARFEEMLSADWQARYGDTYTAITQQIIPQFSDTVVAAARAAVGSAPLYFRPEESIT